MASVQGICGLCHVEPARYKCSTCALPFCSLACYKPHKDAHDVEQELKAKTDEEASVKKAVIKADEAAVPDVPEPEVTAKAPELDFSLLLKNEPLIAALKNNDKLRSHLKSIHSAGLKTTFDAQNARIGQNAGGGGGRGRGRGRGGQHFERRPVEWTAERGTDRRLKRIKALRAGGKDEDGEVEEFSQAVVGILGLYDDGNEKW